MIVALLVLLAALVYGGGQYLIAHNGLRWSQQQAAREAATSARKAHRP